MQRGARIWVGVLLAGVLAAAGCGDRDSEVRREICDGDGECWRIEAYSSEPSDSACVTGKVFPCDGGPCPAYRYLPEREGSCRPFGTTDRSFCTSGVEAWLDPRGGVTRWSRQKVLESTDVCVEKSWGWEYHACLVHPDSYRWRTCREGGESGVALEWTVDSEKVPDETFRVVIQSFVE